jgi:hypothetical protein
LNTGRWIESRNQITMFNAHCNSCEDMACCSSVQCTVQWNSSISETVRNKTHVYIQFLLRMTDTMTSQNIDLTYGTSCISVDSDDPLISALHSVAAFVFVLLRGWSIPPREQYRSVDYLNAFHDHICHYAQFLRIFSKIIWMLALNTSLIYRCVSLELRNKNIDSLLFNSSLGASASLQNAYCNSCCLHVCFKLLATLNMLWWNLIFRSIFEI